MKVIFACVHNAGRSQMAAAFYNTLTKTSEGTSAGTKPGERVHPEVVTVIKEVGFDVSEVKKTCLHEFGHALGLQGHSSRPDDIMYHAISPRQSPTLTARDQATITGLYSL